MEFNTSEIIGAMKCASGIYKCTPEIRWVVLPENGGGTFIEKVIQQKWVDIHTGDEKWEDIPVVEIFQ